MKVKMQSNELERLLDELDAERSKFTKANKQKMREVVDQLVTAGIYPITPAMEKHGYDAMKMVDSYGARWHIWSEPLKCPNCSTDLRDHAVGPPFKREISVYSRELDRTIHFKCPDCGEVIPR